MSRQKKKNAPAIEVVIRVKVFAGGAPALHPDVAGLVDSFLTDPANGVRRERPGRHARVESPAGGEEAARP